MSRFDVLTLFVNGNCHNTVALGQYEQNHFATCLILKLINLRPPRKNHCGFKDKMIPKSNP